MQYSRILGLVVTRWPAAAALAALLSLPVSVAWSHALLIESSPTNGETVTRPPEQVTLRFSSDVEQLIESAVVSLANGTTIQLAIPTSEGETGPHGDRLSVPLPHLTPGDYFFQYKILAADGHTVVGAVQFRVAEPE